MRRHAQKALAAALLALAGCGTPQPATTQQQATQQADAQRVANARACPQVQIVADTAQVTKFRTTAGRDPTDVTLLANLTDFNGGCELDARRNRVLVELTLFFAASRGPANADRRGRFEYFVAIADRTNAIVAKTVFPIEVAFAADTNRAEANDVLEPVIPLRAGESGADYRIYVGFQLSDAERAWNRRQPGR